MQELSSIDSVTLLEWITSSSCHDICHERKREREESGSESILVSISPRSAILQRRGDRGYAFTDSSILLYCDASPWRECVWLQRTYGYKNGYIVLHEYGLCARHVGEKALARLLGIVMPADAPLSSRTWCVFPSLALVFYMRTPHVITFLANYLHIGVSWVIWNETCRDGR